MVMNVLAKRVVGAVVRCGCLAVEQQQQPSATTVKMAAAGVNRVSAAAWTALRGVVGVQMQQRACLSRATTQCNKDNTNKPNNTSSSSSSFSTDFLDAMLPDAKGPNLADAASHAPVRRVMRKGQAVFDSKLERALARIKVSHNNTIVTITTLDGDPIVTKSAGMCGFKGARKSTTYAARVVAQQAGEAAVNKGVMTVSVLVKGLGPGRVNALKGLVESKLMIDQVADVTPVPHNGCRPKKARRL
ncbi:30S ribosomal protein S11 [Salpingoeca rosetta]|uniref:30S ribosomal protein S11 n=1 Tax=Salpingoeca rosetta (strain ATCC 50818 / BSB-021) TaxID=946362 RepID=F2UHK9_SALR5|nr:30S ribosomal protein S11 [Salpingoeca rosetta]EGD76608.1 30S ribosomal protein S11 [Salpingoeca rosetta]|eukprot:XP_004991522.1 30S ribosomal protein S11 [Salpingoeca rosetta]